MAARKNRNRQRRRRRGRFGVLYKLLSFLLIFSALVAGCVVFFRVDQVTVTGSDRYTAQEIIAASGVEQGDNLFLINKPQVVRAITRKLPYIEAVTPVKALPDTLELHIIESRAAAVLEGEEGRWLLNASGKLVEKEGAERKEGLPLVTGLHPVTPNRGGRLTVELEEQVRLEGLKGLLAALEARGMEENVKTFIDLTSANAIYFDYGEELTVVVPTSGNFDRLIFSLQRVVETFQNNGERLTGTLDMTYGDKQARLLTERWLPEYLRPAQPEPDPLPDHSPEVPSEEEIVPPSGSEG